MSPWWQRRYDGWLLLHRNGASQATLQQAWANTLATYERSNRDRTNANLRPIPALSQDFAVTMAEFLQQEHGYAEQLARIDHGLKQWGSKMAQAMNSPQHNEKAWEIYQAG
ncbi:MAG: hypothetical protein MJH10_21600, partial [Epibacterium sp.]|nr:hypothetical protein [Epibacterium sp.]